MSASLQQLKIRLARSGWFADDLETIVEQSIECKFEDVEDLADQIELLSWHAARLCCQSVQRTASVLALLNVRRLARDGARRKRKQADRAASDLTTTTGQCRREPFFNAKRARTQYRRLKRTTWRTTTTLLHKAIERLNSAADRRRAAKLLE